MIEIDKACIRQVLGSLMKRPQYLSEVDRYSLLITDFPSRFEKYIFSAIQNLYHNGAKNIQPIDIESYLETNAVGKAEFKAKNGIEYVQDAIALSDVENFPFYYGRLKKFNLLKDLQKSGFDTSEFYCEDLTNPDAVKINMDFDTLTLQNITDEIKRKLLHLESDYAITGEVETESAAVHIEELIDELGETQEIGLPVQGEIYNQIIDGARKGTLTIRSAASGVGKTRNAIADACFLAYPFRYNSETCKWEQKGNSERVLFIVTEQQFKEVRKMILAYLTDINESRFKYWDFDKREEAVIAQATHLMQVYQDNLILVKIPNPTIELVKTKLREECILHNIEYVFL